MKALLAVGVGTTPQREISGGIREQPYERSAERWSACLNCVGKLGFADLRERSGRGAGGLMEVHGRRKGRRMETKVGRKKNADGTRGMLRRALRSWSGIIERR